MIDARGFAPVMLSVIAVACAPKPTDEQGDPAPNEATDSPVLEPLRSVAEPAPAAPVAGLSPRWRVGDEWDVRYMISVAKWQAWADATDEYQDVDWHYEVGHIADDGTVTVHATSSYDDPWRLVYAPSGRLLAAYGRHDALDNVGEGPFVPLSVQWRAERLATDWPKVPMAPGIERAEDGRWEQNVVERGDKLSVTLVGREDRQGAQFQRIVVQEWDENKPWWSALNVSKGFVRDGVVTDKFEMAGHVTAWRLRDDR